MAVIAERARPKRTPQHIAAVQIPEHGERVQAVLLRIHLAPDQVHRGLPLQAVDAVTVAVVAAGEAAAVVVDAAAVVAVADIAVAADVVNIN